MDSTVAQANNLLGLDLYSQFRKRHKGNLFFSPYSIEAALAMTYDGARGQTADEMRSVLHLSQDKAAVRTAFEEIQKVFNKQDSGCRLNSANALWAQKDYPFLKDYFSTVERYYGGKASNLDFRNSAEAARKIINDWIEQKTSAKIKDLIPPPVDPMTRLVLTNAVYFKGRWAVPFDEHFTREEDFRVSADRTVRVPMMQPTDDTFDYAETEDLQILEMPYAGGRLLMLVLLPKGDAIQKLDETLTEEKLNKCKRLLRKTKVQVAVPRFKFDSKYFMAEDLKNMGMPMAFSGAADFGGAADFSGMTGKKDLYIGQVIHQAFVEVNEEGTEAAAATAVLMREGAAYHADRRPVFKADHPFIFLIQEKETGIVLFLGRVVNPFER